MEIKHTLEILTKDIQDIEKLVGNLQNSQEGSTLELDLALSKLRNLYEILSMIRDDIRSPRPETAKRPGSSTEIPQPAPPAEPEPQAAPRVEAVPVPEPQPEPEIAAEPAPAVATEPEPVAATEPEPLVGTEPGPVVATEPAQPKKEAEIIAEKFSGQSSINENLAGKHADNMDAKLKGQPIDNISRNIGINDRFLIIRELFNGDAEGFGKLVENMEGAGTYQAAVGIIEKSFADSMDHEGVDILVGLARRRFSPA